MTFDEYIGKTREEIKSHFSSFMLKQREEDLPAIFKEQKLIETIEGFAVRGKLLRGTLFLFILEGLGVKPEKRHFDVACAIELMHSALLMQDDVIDKDRTRRGAPTVFAHYEVDGKNRLAEDPYHYGVSTAIVAADVAFFFAIELISQFEESTLGKLLKYYAHEVYLVAVAESVDSIFGQTAIEPDEPDIYAVYKYKTARYTFSLPFEMAAIVAGASDEIRYRLSRLGEHAGIIFQLKDDEIGLFGDEALIGKPVGSDIRENKKTLIRHFLFKSASEQDRQVLRNCFGNPLAAKEEIDNVRLLYNKYEIDKIISEKIESIMKEVWADFENIDLSSDFKNVLKGLLEFNLSRSY